MKRIVFLLISFLLLAGTGFAKDDKSVARMNIDILKMDAALAEKAIAVVSKVPGVIEAKANLQNGKLSVSMAPENHTATRKAVRKAIKDAGIKTGPGGKAKDNKADEKPNKKAKTAK